MFLAGKSPNVRSDTVYIYGSGLPYTYVRNYGVSTGHPWQGSYYTYGVHIHNLANPTHYFSPMLVHLSVSLITKLGVRSCTVYVYGSGQP